MEKFIVETKELLSKYGLAVSIVDANIIDICGRDVKLSQNLDKLKKNLLTVIREVCKGKKYYPLIYKEIILELYHLKTRTVNYFNSPIWKFVSKNYKQTNVGFFNEITRDVNIYIKQSININKNEQAEITRRAILNNGYGIKGYAVEFQYSISSIVVTNGEHPNVDPVTRKFYWSEFKKTPNVVLEPSIFKRIEQEMAVADYSDYYIWE
jgi:hypothetical protein